MSLISLPVYSSKIELTCESVDTISYKSHTYLNTRHGYTKGLEQDFCLFLSSDESKSALVSKQALLSENPSIAATYLLKGLDLTDFPPGHPNNPGADFCQRLKGTSLAFYGDGGFQSKYGLDEVCMFADGSAVSIWAIIRRTLDEKYLGIKDKVQSKHLELDLPYLKIVFIK